MPEKIEKVYFTGAVISGAYVSLDPPLEVNAGDVVTVDLAALFGSVYRSGICVGDPDNGPQLLSSVPDRDVPSSLGRENHRSLPAAEPACSDALDEQR